MSVSSTSTPGVNVPEAAARSVFGYSTTSPMHREVRAALCNRDMKENSRIHAGHVVPASNPLKSETQSAGYLSPVDRFTIVGKQKVSLEEQQRRDREQSKIQHLKQLREVREKERWARMDDLRRREAEDAAKLAGTGIRNRGSVGYNLINGSWGSSDAAAIAKYHDDSVEYRAKLRTENLDRRSNSSFNVITGEPRSVVRVPPPPVLS